MVGRFSTIEDRQPYHSRSTDGTLYPNWSTRWEILRDCGTILCLENTEELPMIPLGLHHQNNSMDKGPLQIMRAQWTTTTATSKDVITYITTIQDQFELLKELSRDKEEEKKSSHKLLHDKKVRHRSFQPGDLVLLRTPSLGPKLLAKWDRQTYPSCHGLHH